MAMQQTNSSFAKKLGARVAQANAEHKDKPIDTGNRRLPAGIKAGIAKVQFMYTKENDKDDGVVPKGENFFRGSAVVLGQLLTGPSGQVLVEDHKGETIKGLTTSVVIPLCDIDAKTFPSGYVKEAVSFSQNWFDFQNIFKLLSNGSIVFPEPPIDPNKDMVGAMAQGQRIEAFYFSAMAALTNPKNPIYVEFSTEAIKGKQRKGETNEQYAAREPFIKETWRGLTQLPSNGQYDPGAGVNEAPTTVRTMSSVQHPTDPPPNGAVQTQVDHTAPPQSAVDQNQAELDEIAELVKICLADPDITTPEASEASTQLEEMAWQQGWTREQTTSAKDWTEVGRMALGYRPTTGGTATTPERNSGGPSTNTVSGKYAPAIAVGSKWMYAKRTKEGHKLKDSKGNEFPPSECEVTMVDYNTKICTLKTIHDGKDVVDIRTKTPSVVKFEWLEQAPPY
jgi:hypothetical protein